VIRYSVCLLIAKVVRLGIWWPQHLLATYSWCMLLSILKCGLLFDQLALYFLLKSFLHIYKLLLQNFKLIQSSWLFICFISIPHDVMLAWILAMALCLCLSVPVTSRCYIERDEWIKLVFGTGVSPAASPVLCLKEIQVSTNMRVLPSGTLF